MSQLIRQANLFASEDFLKVYRAFKDVNFAAYDYDTIRTSLIEYMKRQYPEDFNDYIESSEFIALIELLSILATSIAFRTDLNSRENFLDTASRRDSVIRLARMLSYTPKRNIPARGLLKVTAIQTTEPVTDSLGRNLQNEVIFWNDANNTDSFEQFISIINSALNPSNPFGKPFKSGSINDVPTDIYQFNNTSGSRLVHNFSIRANNTQLPIEVVNVDFNDGETFFERHPNPSNAFHVIYRNDSKGLGSPQTGFFFYFRQGELVHRDYKFDFPIENRTLEIQDVTRINEDDVYVQEIDQSGNVINEWTKVPSLVGNNVIFNSLELDQRNIFAVIPGFEDRITLRFADGNFGEVPKGIFRVWMRRSLGEYYTIRPENLSNYQISINYNSKSGQQHSLTVYLKLEESVSNSAPAETDEDIKLRAPQVFYTQNRMVNSEDYNVFPLVKGNEIEKVRSINRTHAGHSRFIDINDPTGVHQNIILFGEDGLLYRDYEPQRLTVRIEDGVVLDTLIRENILQFFKNQELVNYFYDEYYKNFTNLNPGIFDYSSLGNLWKTVPGKANNDTGFIMRPGGLNEIKNGLAATFAYAISTNLDVYSYIKAGSRLRFRNPHNTNDIMSVAVHSVKNSGVPSSPSVSSIGPIEISREVPDLWELYDVIPAFRTELNDEEILAIVNEMELQSDFGLGYDLEDDSWYIIPSGNLSITNENDFNYSSKGTDPDRSWLIYFDYQAPSGPNELPSYSLMSRGMAFVFGSNKEVRFFFDPEQKAIDVSTGRELEDEIEILSLNFKPSVDETWEYNGSSWVFGDLSFEASEGLPLRSRNYTSDNLETQNVGITINDYVIRPGMIRFNDDYIPQVGHRIEITYNNQETLDSSISWNVDDVYILEDGHLDATKVKIKPIDNDEDGISDYPLSFDQLVGPSDRIFFARFTDFDGYQYFRPYVAAYAYLETIVLNQEDYEISGYDINEIDIYECETFSVLEDLVDSIEDISNGDIQFAFASALEGKIVYITNENIFMTFPLIVPESELDPGVRNIDNFEETDDYYVKNGRSFSFDTTESHNPFWFKWKHYAPRDNRIDPSIGNIIDMYVLTKSYYNEVQLWKDENKGIDELPEKPTTEELRIQFGDLNDYKMISDELVFHSASFKPLFGDQAAEEHRCTFKVVKIPTTTISDNEIKARVVQAIDEYFDIRNWDFGEAFYYTELSAYIHQRLATIIASIVIVPNKAESQFGNLFQIKAEPTELFISTATVSNIQIVNNLTETNLRVKR